MTHQPGEYVPLRALFLVSLPYIFQVLCFSNVKISGERLQDQWSSGLI